MTASRNLPARLPAYQFDGQTGKDWSGLTLRWSDAPTLPLLYLSANLTLLPGSPSVRFVGSQANNQFMPFRRPNVVFHFSATQLATLISGNSGHLARANALGLVVADVPTSPNGGEPGRITGRTVLAGLPSLGGDPDQGPVPPARYSGGRLLVVLALGGAEYVSADVSDEYAYDAQPEGAAYCSVAQGGPYDAGTGTIPATANVGINMTFSVTATHYDELSADVADLESASARFDRLKVVCLSSQELEASVEVTLEAVCFDTVAGANTLVPAAAPTTVTNGAYVSAVNAQTLALNNEINSRNKPFLVAAGSISVDEILEFFEAA